MRSECKLMFGIRKRRPPPFGGVHVDDDKDIQDTNLKMRLGMTCGQRRACYSAI